MQLLSLVFGLSDAQLLMHKASEGGQYSPAALSVTWGFAPDVETFWAWIQNVWAYSMHTPGFFCGFNAASWLFFGLEGLLWISKGIGKQW